MASAPSSELVKQLKTGKIKLREVDIPYTGKRRRLEILRWQLRLARQGVVVSTASGVGIYERRHGRCQVIVWGNRRQSQIIISVTQKGKRIVQYRKGTPVNLLEMVVQKDDLILEKEVMPRVCDGTGNAIGPYKKAQWLYLAKLYPSYATERKQKAKKNAQIVAIRDYMMPDLGATTLNVGARISYQSQLESALDDFSNYMRSTRSR